MNVAVVAHCDWSMDKKKRWMTVAIRDGFRWKVHVPELVGDTSTLIDRLRTRSVENGSLLLGFDFPIGLPQAYARATELGSFRGALAMFGSGIWSDWYSVADHRSRISVHRPFYPARPGGTQRSHLFDALGIVDPAIAASYLRARDSRTAGRLHVVLDAWRKPGRQRCHQRLARNHRP